MSNKLHFLARTSVVDGKTATRKERLESSSCPNSNGSRTVQNCPSTNVRSCYTALVAWVAVHCHRALSCKPPSQICDESYPLHIQPGEIFLTFCNRLKIMDDRSIGKDNLLAWACVRLDRLQPGYRFIHLLNSSGMPSPGALLVHVSKRTE